MNKEMLIDAIANLDDSLIDSVLIERDSRSGAARARAAFMRVIPIAAAVAILASGLIAVFSLANRNKPQIPGADVPIVIPPISDADESTGTPETNAPETDAPPITTEPIYEDKNTPVDGAEKLYDSYYQISLKPSTKIDVYMVMYINTSTCIYKNDPYYLLLNSGIMTMHENAKAIQPVMTVNIVNGENTASNIADSYSSIRKPGAPSVNGEEKYKKEYSSDETEKMLYVCERTERDKETKMVVFYPDLPQKDETVFDFSDLEPGTIGKIHITLNTKTSSKNDIVCSPARLILSFCVGHNYVGLSTKNVDDAINNLAQIECPDNDSPDTRSEYFSSLFN